MNKMTYSGRTKFELPSLTDDEAPISTRLPRELLLRVLSYLDVVSLCRCAQVSKLWNILALDGSNWQRIDLFDFQTDVEGPVIENISLRCGGFLRQLSLRGCQSVADGSIRTLAQHCANIEDLNLNKCKKLTDLSIQALSRHCSKLTCINLDSCPNITDLSLKALSDGCTALVSVNVSWCLVTENGVEALARGCPRLKCFVSKGCKQVNDRAVICLARFCGSLEVLNLHGCETLTDESVCQVAERCTQLRQLCLTGCVGLTDVSLSTLANNSHYLSTLEVAQCAQFTDVGFQALGRNCRLLERMDLEECVLITDSSLVHLAMGCPRLEKLTLSHCELITDEGIRQLASSPCAAENLSVLELDNCPLITDATLEHLIACHNLQRIELYDCQLVTRNAIRRLRSHLPNIKVHAYFAPVTPPPAAGGPRPSDKTLRVWRWQDGAGFKEEDISPVCGHKYGVTSIRVSPKGDLLASSSVDGTTILWDLANLNRLHVLVQDSGEAVRACAFSFDAIILATAGDSGAICVWKIPECNLACIIRHHEDAVHSLCFTPDSQILLTACTMGNVRLTFNSWRNCLDVGDRATESLYSLDAAHDLGVLSADFSRKVVSGKHSRVTIYMAVTCGTDRFIKLWRVVSTYPKTEETLYEGNLLPKVTVQLLFAIQEHGSSVTCVKFNFGGDMLASSSLDKTIKFWSVQMHCRATLAEHTRYVNCIGFNSDSALLCSGSNDRSVLIWDMSGNLTLASNLARPHSFLASAFNTDIPDYFLCPITHELLVDPVTCEDDFTYERQAIEAWFQSGHSCSPMTNEELSSTELISNITIKEEIRQFSIANSLL